MANSDSYFLLNQNNAIPYCQNGNSYIITITFQQTDQCMQFTLTVSDT